MIECPRFQGSLAKWCQVVGGVHQQEGRLCAVLLSGGSMEVLDLHALSGAAWLGCHPGGTATCDFCRLGRFALAGAGY